MTSVGATVEPSTVERLGLLAGRPIFRGIAAPVPEEVDAAMESVHVPGGACLVERGQTDVPLLLFVQGGLRASFVDAQGRRRVVFEYFGGATLCEGLLLSGRPSPVDLHAIRESHVLRLAPDRFSAIALRMRS